jgi:ketosteroid isomerase-like protein
VSEPNLALIDRAFDAFAEQDVEGFVRCMDPEVEFEPRLAGVEGSYRGHDGVGQFMADGSEAIELRRTDVDEVRDLGDRVLALGTFHVRGRESGAEDATPFALLGTIRDGRFVTLKDYGDSGAALEAAGLAG